jgi:hypothetical protein
MSDSREFVQKLQQLKSFSQNKYSAKAFRRKFLSSLAVVSKMEIVDSSTNSLSRKIFLISIIEAVYASAVL